MTQRLLAPLLVLLTGTAAWAEPPAASYIFPAGGQRGTTVAFKVGGLNLHESCGFEMIGPGLQAPNQLKRIKTFWLEGPVLPLPDSQQAESYPKDMAGELKLADDAAPGLRHCRLWTSQGATPSLKFMVGDLPEIIEQEIAGDPLPVEVKLPVTINGRIFPREDIDIWSFQAVKGQTIVAEVHASQLGSPLDSRLEVTDALGKRLLENDDAAGADSRIAFTAPADGTYHIRIHDIQFKGGPAYVYRLTLQARPYVASFYPLGGRRGSTATFELQGQGLREQKVAVTIPGDASQRFLQRVDGTALPLDVDDVPEYLHEQRPEVISVPAMLNGRIAKPGHIDQWTVALRKGENLEFDLRAARLGSPLCAVMSLSDSAGKELFRAENLGGPSDPQRRLTVPADGNYIIKVQDCFRERGGSGHAYRLRIGAPVPNYQLTLPSDAVTVARGATAKLKVHAERLGGFSDAINLEIDGLPAGVTATGTVIPASGAVQSTLDITLKADATAKIQTSPLTIRGTAKIGVQIVKRTATLGEGNVHTVLLAVALPTPFKIVGNYDMRWAARGSTHERGYRIERNGYDGPIEVSLADVQARHLQGVTGPTILVPAGATEFRYRISLPPWMETGRTCRVCVIGFAKVKDSDGSEHVVSFSSVNQNEQIVAVVEPGRLSVEAAPASVTAIPGQSAEVNVQVGRGKSLVGAVTLELVVPPHLTGITAEPVIVPADQATGKFTIRFGTAAQGPFNMPLLLRATLMERGHPIVAETHLAVASRPR